MDEQETFFCRRYKPNTLPQFPSCDHSRKAFQCATSTCTEIRKFHQSFYKHSTKISQDNFLIKHCTITVSKTAKVSSKRNHSLKYFIRNKTGKMIPVCQKTFTMVLCLKKIVYMEWCEDFMKRRRWQKSVGVETEKVRSFKRKEKRYKPL